MPHLERLKHRLVRQAVGENLEAILGRPPRALRRSRRWWDAVVRHYRLVIGPALLFLSVAVLAAGGGESHDIPSRATSLEALSRRLAVSAAGPIDSAAFPLGVKRVVLDPGHGGLDPGAQGDAELIEKEITLDVARRLRGLLQGSGLAVAMTREADQTVPVRDRVRLANAARGDLFLSIHVNAIPSAEACGIETYAVGPTDDPRAQQLAGVENRDSGYSLADFRRLLDGVYVHVRQRESHRLAETVQRGLVAYLGSAEPAAKDGGVKTAPFMVLVGTEMPGVLVELSCLSNPEQAARLADPAHRQSIARGLFVGLSAYAEARNQPGRPSRPRGSS